jgi:hypothetical protein
MKKEKRRAPCAMSALAKGGAGSSAARLSAKRASAKRQHGCRRCGRRSLSRRECTVCARRVRPRRVLAVARGCLLARVWVRELCMRVGAAYWRAESFSAPACAPQGGPTHLGVARGRAHPRVPSPVTLCGTVLGAARHGAGLALGSGVGAAHPARTARSCSRRRRVRAGSA